MTLPTLQSWPDFDDDGEPMSETVIGFDITPIAIVLAGNHHDAFLRLALAAPDLYAELVDLIDWLEFNKQSIGAVFLMESLLSGPRAAIAKAKGE